MIIPVSSLSEDTLINIIESFVLREGTDYGFAETKHETKVNQIKQQLQSGKLVVTFSQLHETCTIMEASNFQ